LIVDPERVLNLLERIRDERTELDRLATASSLRLSTGWVRRNTRLRPPRLRPGIGAVSITTGFLAFSRARWVEVWLARRGIA
jgi:hypothetical protein